MTGTAVTSDTFEAILAGTPVSDLVRASLDATTVDVYRAIGRAEAGQADLWDFAALISPAGGGLLEEIGQAARRVTERRFGRAVHLFAPLYLSNECLSTCIYCGFSKDLDIRRRTLTPEEVQREARHLLHDGFRHVLLVSAEHRKHVSPEYLELVLRRLHPDVPSLTIETEVWDTDHYERFREAGCEGVVIYQETYDPATYARTHVGGRKRHYGYRLAGPERVARAGLRRIGIGALFGLHPQWREDAVALAAHGDWLVRTYWRLEVTAAFPRMRPSASGFEPAHLMGDREFVQLTAAYRLFLHDVGIVLSTREPASLRDGLLPFGITHMSAGSHTEPGGYEQPGDAEEQFAISDQRSPAEVVQVLRARGYDPVWKDWSAALAGDALEAL
ncbi:MAG TPA: 2-iminoacetate synthase ThiH [Nitriliruptorales bacterium]